MIEIIISLLIFGAADLAHGGPCDAVANNTNAWPGGFTIAMIIPIKTTISSWTLDLTFSSAVTTVSAWNVGTSTTNDNVNFHMTNAAYNGAQTAGTIFINPVGFNVNYPVTNVAPIITAVLFNGVNICTSSGSTTTSVPTTKTTTPAPTTKITTVPSTVTTPSSTTSKVSSTTVPSTTTSAPGGSCNTVANNTNSWPGGFQINMVIPITTTISSWTMDLTFSSAVTISAWNIGTSTTTDNKNFRLTNAAYNGAQTAGTIFNTVGFTVSYSGTVVPIITSVLFNGVNICSSSGSTTTSKPTTPTTTISTTTSITPSTTTPLPTTTSKTSTTTVTPITTTASPNPLPTKYNYSEVITKSLLFYYAQRSGKLPTNDNPIPYRSDSALGDKGVNGEDLTGGYYDAGDFVKFGFPMAGTTTIVAWSIIDYPLGYSSAGQLTTAQKMVRWATDYFIKAHVAPNQFYGQVGDGNADHAYWGRPEDMTMARPSAYISASAPGSDLAGETAAALAAASLVFAQADPTYSSLCLLHAVQLYSFATTYQGIYSNSMPAAAGFYSSSGFGDELAWAAIWLYRATGTASYLNDAKSFYTLYGLGGDPGSFSWDNKAAGVQVMLAKMTGNSSPYTTDAQTFCNNRISSSQSKTNQGLIFISPWGSIRSAANIAFICLQTADLGVSNALAYRQMAQKQIHYALGDTGRSFVNGFGTNPPTHPHHRSSSCPNKPATCDWNTYNMANSNYQILYGALVGGPKDTSDTYVDVRSDYQANEVAVDYNAAFQGSVAALQSLAVQRKFN